MTTIWHAVAGYVFLVVTVRVLARRPGAQMTLAEFVLVFLIGGVIILATVGPDKSMTNCVCAVITVALMHWLVSSLKMRYPKFGEWVDGTPLVLVEHGEWRMDMLRAVGLAEEDVMTAARASGVRSREGIDYAILERNGGISVFEHENEE